MSEEITLSDPFNEAEIDPSSLATDVAIEVVRVKIGETKEELDRVHARLTAEGLRADELRERLEFLLDVLDAGVYAKMGAPAW